MMRMIYGKPNSRAHFPDSHAQLGYTIDNKRGMLLKDFEHRVSHLAPHLPSLIMLACVRTQHQCQMLPQMTCSLAESLEVFRL